YTWDAYHSIAFAKKCHVCTWDPKWQTPGSREAEHANLTAAPPGQPLYLLLYTPTVCSKLKKQLKLLYCKFYSV
ncbi:hypothetical protein, partial [Pseudomonas aeruginosa]|uniref:hypothetical protein n=1 Tax=Pseudomonas aeruginosa TaxID=287 RepID=UPI002E8E7690|nr:hypothetical protein [Pseudomonas aeruginosa]